MSKQAFATVQKSFADEVVRAFGPLAAELALSGPELQGTVLPVAAYAGHGVRYRIMLDTDDKAVATRVETDYDGKRLVVELDNLVQAAGLGTRNQVPRSAQTLNALRRTLDAHAGYARLLQPHLRPEMVVAIMRAAGAREWPLT